MTTHNPYNEIAKLLHSTGKQHAKRAAIAVGLSLGTITDNGVLLDDFKEEITDYWVSQHLAIPSDVMANVDNVTITDAGTTLSSGTGQVVTPSQLQPLTTGDRVLVAPVNGGNDFVIIARVVIG